MDLHSAIATGTTPWGEDVRAKGWSGNQRGAADVIYRKYSRAERANAVIFMNFLDRLDVSRGGGKTAFTCAEPKAIIGALLKGATLSSIRVKDIKCLGDRRTPCTWFCSTYLQSVGNGVYKIRPWVLKQLTF